jgi:regulator of RNase E activity RraA
LLAQPAHQQCAALGGIHAARLARLGCAGIVVSGRVRDREEIGGLVSEDSHSQGRQGKSFTVWNRGYSIVGAGAEGHVVAMGEDVNVGDANVRVRKGDYLLCDFEESAIVRVPQELAVKALAWAKLRSEQDSKALEYVQSGGGVGEAFKTFRSKIVV